MRRYREAAGAAGAKCLGQKGARFTLSSETRLELVQQSERWERTEEEKVREQRCWWTLEKQVLCSVT